MTLDVPAATPTDVDDVGAKLAEICEAAAALILPLWRSGLTVMSKADESPVTEAEIQLAIAAVTNQEPSADDIHQVSARLASVGWPLATPTR